MNAPVVVSSPIQQIPSYLSLQIHPSKKVIEIVQTINQTCLNFFKKFNEESSFAPHFTLPELATPHEDCRNIHLSSFMMKQIPIALAPYLPPETVGFYLALQYLEKHVLATPLSAYQPDQILEIILTFQGCLSTDANHLKQLNSTKSSQFPKGVLRCDSEMDHQTVVWDSNMFPSTRTKETFQQIDAYIMQNKEAKQKELWKKTRLKVWNHEFKKANQSSSVKIKEKEMFTEEEKELLKDFAFFPPEKEKVRQLITQFTQDLYKKIQANEDNLELRTWAHQTFTDIHPFLDANGRTARIIMAWLALSAGKKPPLMDSDENYTAATRSTNKQAFANYLRTLENHPTSFHDFIHDCLYQLYQDTCQETGIHQLLSRIKIIKF